MKGKLLVGIQFACLIGLVVVPGQRDGGWRHMLSLLLLGLSLGVLLIAFWNLRRSVTVFPEPREDVPFVTGGIYRYVRHPMYSGVLLFGLSEVVATASPVALALFVVLFADLTVKHRYEDALLAAKWPAAAAYQQHVGALLPRFRR